MLLINPLEEFLLKLKKPFGAYLKKNYNIIKITG